MLITDQFSDRRHLIAIRNPLSGCVIVFFCMVSHITEYSNEFLLIRKSVFTTACGFSCWVQIIFQIGVIWLQSGTRWSDAWQWFFSMATEISEYSNKFLLFYKSVFSIAWDFECWIWTFFQIENISIVCGTTDRNTLSRCVWELNEFQRYRSEFLDSRRLLHFNTFGWMRQWYHEYCVIQKNSKKIMCNGRGINRFVVHFDGWIPGCTAGPPSPCSAMNCASLLKGPFPVTIFNREQPHFRSVYCLQYAAVEFEI